MDSLGRRRLHGHFRPASRSPCNGEACSKRSQSLGRSFSRAKASVSEEEPHQAEMDAIETPMSWFISGQLVSLVALAWLANATFGMPVWQSAIAVPLAFFLSLVACRVTGETDTTPVGAMGQTTQLDLQRPSAPAAPT